MLRGGVYAGPKGPRDDWWVKLYGTENISEAEIKAAFRFKRMQKMYNELEDLYDDFDINPSPEEAAELKRLLDQRNQERKNLIKIWDLMGYMGDRYIERQIGRIEDHPQFYKIRKLRRAYYDLDMKQDQEENPVKRARLLTLYDQVGARYRHELNELLRKNPMYLQGL